MATEDRLLELADHLLEARQAHFIAGAQIVLVEDDGYLELPTGLVDALQARIVGIQARHALTETLAAEVLVLLDDAVKRHRGIGLQTPGVYIHERDEAVRVLAAYLEYVPCGDIVSGFFGVFDGMQRSLAHIVFVHPRQYQLRVNEGVEIQLSDMAVNVDHDVLQVVSLRQHRVRSSVAARHLHGNAIVFGNPRVAHKDRLK